MTRFHYLTLGYALIWFALGVYLFLLDRKISKVRSELEELRARIKRAGGEP